MASASAGVFASYALKQNAIVYGAMSRNDIQSMRVYSPPPDRFDDALRAMKYCESVCHV